MYMYTIYMRSRAIYIYIDRDGHIFARRRLLIWFDEFIYSNALALASFGLVEHVDFGVLVLTFI